MKQILRSRRDKYRVNFAVFLFAICLKDRIRRPNRVLNLPMRLVLVQRQQTRLHFTSSGTARVRRLDIDTSSPTDSKFGSNDGTLPKILQSFLNSLPKPNKIYLQTFLMMTLKQMNLLVLHDVIAITEAFQTQVCGSTSIFVHEYYENFSLNCSPF